MPPSARLGHHCAAAPGLRRAPRQWYRLAVVNAAWLGFDLGIPHVLLGSPSLFPTGADVTEPRKLAPAPGPGPVVCALTATSERALGPIPAGRALRIGFCHWMKL